MSAVLWSALIDVALGEPPARIHPTVAMGNFVRACKPGIRPRPSHAFARGAGISLGGVALSAAAGFAADLAIARLSGPWRGIARGALLKPALAIRSLLSAAQEIETALERDDLIEARRLLAWHLVSRDTSELSAEEVAVATIESISENLSDSVIAPLCAFRVGGLGAAYAYRFINTADAMLGYRTSELEWLGKFPARVDDIANIVPARLSALLIALCAPIGYGSTQHAVRIACRDAKETASPNAGWPMAAMAGALNRHLNKRDVYALNGTAKLPDARDICRARHIVAAAATLGVVVASVYDG